MQNSDDDNPNDDEKNSFYDSQVLLLGKDNINYVYKYINQPIFISVWQPLVTCLGDCFV